MADAQKELQALTDEYQKFQTGLTFRSKMSLLSPKLILTFYFPAELEGIVEARQKLEAQQQENQSVQKVRLRLRICESRKI